MGGAPEESPEEKRARKAAERRARRDRIIQNQEFLTDRTASLRRQFGLAPGNFGGQPSPRSPFTRQAVSSLGFSLFANSRGARSGLFGG